MPAQGKKSSGSSTPTSASKKNGALTATTRHKKAAKPGKTTLSRSALRRIMYRANVTRATADVFAPLQEEAGRFVRNVMRDAYFLLSAGRRRKLTTTDLRRALSRHGVTFLGLPNV